MTDRQPSEVTNLDRYGHSVLPWSRPHDLLSSGPNGPLTGSSSARCARTGARMSPGSARSGTTATCISPAGFTSGPGTRKARNLASNPACTIAVKFSGLDLTLEGEAAKVTDPAILDRVASIYRDIGWPAEVAGDAVTAPCSAPSAGPPLWHLYRFTFHTVVGLSTTEPNGATCWRFS